MRIWCNGRLVGADEAVAGPLDRGLRVGLGVFETLLCLDGRPVAWERHVSRMTASAGRFGIESPGLTASLAIAETLVAML